jgi:hypothetical protein
LAAPARAPAAAGFDDRSRLSFLVVSLGNPPRSLATKN